MVAQQMKPMYALVALILSVLINGCSSAKYSSKPVGTPRVYTTFITDNSTATAVIFGTPKLLTQLPGCSEPSGGFLVYTIWTSHADKELYRVNIDGTNQCRLTDNEVADAQPSISPDGREIAFVSFDEDMQQSIYLIDINGSNRRKLTGGGSAYSFPTWSPDGKHLVFQATIDELFDLYIINHDGTDLLRLTSDTSLDITPNWSSDGEFIAFSSDRTFDPK
jgi:Tol biopolymer transport system component